MIRATVAGTADLSAAVAKIKSGHRQLRGELAAGLRKPTDEGLRLVRGAIARADMRGFRRGGRRFPSRWGGETPFKRPLSNAFEGKVTTSSSGPKAEIQLRPSRVPMLKRPLIPYVVGQRGRGRVRHPVLGNRSAWVSQRMPDIWTTTVANRKTIAKYQAAAKAAVDRVARKMA